MTDDLISRQAAIDALKNDMASLDHIIKGMSAYDVRLDAYVSQRNQVNCDIDTINNLPTAQPEQRWIPCSEKLPTEEEKSYWVCTSEGEQCVCRWTDDRYGFGHSGKWGWHYLDLPQYSKGVAAYMPLPKAYREGDAE